MQTNHLRAALLAVLSVLAVAFAACGGSDPDADTADLGPDPVAMAPADAPFYTEIVVRPEGSIGDDLNSALSKLLGTDDPGATIREAIDAGLASDQDSADFTYADDVEPWLGSRAGIFLTGYDTSAAEATGAAAIAVTDPTAAQAFIDKAAEADSATETDSTYEGVDYKLDESGTAVGIDGDFLLAGTEQAFKDAVDAAAGDSLADNADATAALDDAPDNSLFSFYVDTPAVVELIKSSADLGPAELQQIDDQLAQFGDGPIEAWGTVTDSTFAIGGSAPTAEGATGPSDLISSFPADSWLAFASAGVGDQLQTTIDQFETGFKTGFESAAPAGANAADFDPLAQFEKRSGIDLQTDLAWIGDAGGFVQGTSIFGLGGGLVLEATDEAAASDTLGKIESALQGNRDVDVSPSSSGDGFNLQVVGAPVGAEVALQDGKVIAAVGADTVDDVVSPDETLDASDRFNTAKGALADGATPSFFLDFGPVVDLVESSGQATSDPQYQMAKPYIDALDYIVSGSSVDGDRTSGSFVLGVKEATATTDATAATITP